MPFLQTVVFLCGVLLRPAAAQVVQLGQCPDVTVVTDFKPAQYLGKWYEEERYFAVFEAGSKCVTAVYSDNGNGTVGVRNANINKLTGQTTAIEGTATLADPSVAKLVVRFPSVGNRPAPYWVLSTDYTSYALVWSCENGFLSRTVNCWILTRDQNPSQDVLNKAYEAADNNNIDKSLFQTTDQSNCPQGN